MKAIESKRQKQVGKLVQEVVSNIFILHGREIYGNTFVTITGVYMTPDLEQARIYISLYNTEDKNHILEIIKAKSYEIKKLMAETLRRQMRKMPQPEFIVDEPLDEVFKLEELFKNLNNPDHKED